MPGIADTATGGTGCRAACSRVAGGARAGAGVELVVSGGNWATSTPAAVNRQLRSLPAARWPRAIEPGGLPGLQAPVALPSLPSLAPAPVSRPRRDGGHGRRGARATAAAPAASAPPASSSSRAIATSSSRAIATSSSRAIATTPRGALVPGRQRAPGRPGSRPGATRLAPACPAGPSPPAGATPPRGRRQWRFPSHARGAARAGASPRPPAGDTRPATRACHPAVAPREATQPCPASN